MAKAFFRFLRGEINGFYLNSIHNTLNNISEEDKKFLADFSRLVIKKASEVRDDEYPIPKDMLLNIGLIVGILPPRITSESFSGSIRFPTSKVVDGVEYSERGLFNEQKEDFDFVHTTQDEYEDDINTLATDSAKTSLVGDDDEVTGYLEEGVEILKADGTIDLSKISDYPPQDKAYSEFYGTQYLYLAENESVTTDLIYQVYLDLLKAVQWIRYNGVSIQSLCKIFELICPAFVTIDEIDWSNEIYGVVKYTVDDEFITDNKQVKIETLKLLIQMKFPQLVMIENE